MKTSDIFRPRALTFNIAAHFLDLYQASSYYDPGTKDHIVGIFYINLNHGFGPK